MKIKQEALFVLILILVVVGLFSYLGSQGWFQPKLRIVQNTTIIERLKEVQIHSPSCTLAFTPLAIFTGDELTGIIQDGSETFCEVYAYNGIDWYIVYVGVTDATGRLASTQEIYFEGVIQFRAICEDCLTNSVNVYVNPIPAEDEDFHEDFECNAGCGIRGYDFGTCSLIEPYYPSINIGVCSYEEDYCWCWNEEGGGGGDEGGEGTDPYSSSECESLMIEYGKDFYALVDNKIECEDYGFDVCNLHETYMENYDWYEPNCCIINCHDYP